MKPNASAQGTGTQLTLAHFILAALLVMPAQLMAQPLPTLPPVGYDQSGRYPAGTVTWNVSYYSSVAGRNLNMHVYTPPGYNPSQNYGVIYCYQGIGAGADTTFLDWSVYAGLVADNLIGEGKIKPVIIVALDDQFDGTWSDVNGMTIRDAIPYVDSHYSTYADADHRGVYGYSWGGGYAFNVGCGNLDTFRHIAPSSAAPSKAADSTLFPNGGAEAKQKLKTLLIACGNADGLYGASEGAHNYCVANGIPHTWWPVAGGGHWANEVWRPHMWNFLQMAYAAGISDPPLPRSAYSRNEAENYDQRQGVTPESCSEGGQDIGMIESGAYVAYNNVDFGTGAVSFNARVASATSGGSIEIRLGGTNGTLVGTCPVTGTGGWQTWTTVSCAISGASGIQNVYLRFTGGSGYLFNVNWWQFDGPISPVAIPPVPSGLVALSGKERAVLRWNASSGATSYNVKRFTTSGGPYITISSVAGTNYTDTAAIGGTTYYYKVSALNLGGESADTSFASVTPAVDVPSPWLTQDIGAVGLPGWASFTNGVFTVTGCGADISGTSDAFRFVHVATNGNCTIVARVASLESHVSTWSKAGVMIRESLDTNAANAFIAVTPGNGVTWQYRSTTGGATTSVTTAGPSAPYWVRLVRSGNTFIGSYSSDGVNWTQLGSPTFAMSSSAHIGLALTSRNLYTLCTATFDRVTAPGWAPPPAGIPSSLVATAGVERVTLNWTAATNATSYNVKRATSSAGPYTTITNVVTTNFTDTRVVGRTTYYYVVSAVSSLAGESANSGHVSATPTVNLPLPWMTREIGSVGLAGGAGFTNGVFTVTGSGSDIWGSSDAFRYVYVATNSGNFSITARVLSLQNTDPWAKAGVMIRSSLDANAVNAFIAVTRGNGVTFQNRSSTGGNSANNNTTGLNAPYWVRLVRSGDTFTAFRSANGTSWTQHGSVTLSNISTAYIGLAVTSHNNSQTCAATFDNVTAPGWPPTELAAVATANSSSQVTLSWNPAANATSYNVKRSLSSGGPYTTIATGITNTSFVDYDAPVGAGCFYVISAVVGGNEIPNGPEAALSFPNLTGGIIGTPGSWGGSGNTITNVFDNDLNTFFDAPSGNGAWVGLDFGAGVSNVITKINYCPRSGFESRMTNGIFQGANQANFSDAVTLVTITNQPAPGGFTSVNLTNTAGFRHVRYLSPNGGYGNVAELEFYGYPAPVSVPTPSAPTGLVATAISSSQINLVWNTLTNASSYNVKRSTTNGGPYTVIATGVTATNYTDTGLANGTTYYYVVSALNQAGESPHSAQASVTPQGMMPTGLSATAVSASQINLVWNLLPNATSYNVKHSLTNGGPYAPVATGLTATNYQDSSLAGGTIYYYVVSAIVSGSEGQNSAQVIATTPSPTEGSLVHRYSFSETNGNMVADSVGGPVWNGTLPNGGTLAGGQLALSSSAQQYASLPAGIVGGLSNITVMAWVNLASVSYWSRIFDFGNDTTTYMYLTPRNGFDYTTRFTISTSGAGGEQKINCNQAVNLGAWHQVAVTLHAGTGIVYVDGVAVGTNASLTLNPSQLGSTTRNYLGKSQGTEPYLNGALDEFRIYNVGLSAAEIAATAALGPDQLLSPNRPQMSLAVSGTNLTLSWPLANAGFTLQSCTNLALGDWVNVASPAPQIVGSNWQVTLLPPATAGAGFCRLAK